MFTITYFCKYVNCNITNSEIVSHKDKMFYQSCMNEVTKNYDCNFLPSMTEIRTKLITWLYSAMCRWQGMMYVRRYG